MKKLLELLNQCMEERWRTFRFISIVENDFFQIKWKEWLWYETVLSKKFWFIDRLVDRDRIDLDKLKDNTMFTMLTHCVWLWCKRWDTARESQQISKSIWASSIVAYLSIDDDPVWFLSSILK